MPSTTKTSTTTSSTADTSSAALGSAPTSPRAPSAVTAAGAVRLVLDEVSRSAATLLETDPAALDRLVEAIEDADRVFLLGAGRSGLALRGTAMRLMHLGLTAHVAGDATAPAVRGGDLLLVASGSGTTAGIVRAVHAAQEAGARVAAITADPRSTVADAADLVVLVRAPGKEDHSATASAQFSGSLFEQTVSLLGDAVVHTLWQRSGRTADDLYSRHANLE